MVSDCFKTFANGLSKDCLNPCFNGIWSRTKMLWLSALFWSLNPCFNGIWSRTSLISTRWKRRPSVLILVLIEYGLGLMDYQLNGTSCACLNPCFNGIWSRTQLQVDVQHRRSVLILVLMEYGLGLMGKCTQ